MATRQTTHILKNSNIVNRPLPSTLLQGEPIVNTADGIVYFSGVTSSTNNWTPAGTGTTANFFEAGSNLYNLKIRNQITSYSGLTNLSGKFLSGTTSGFVLADVSAISGVDTYVTGFTYSNNLFTIKRNLGQADLTASINTMTGLTISGDLTVTGGTQSLFSGNSSSEMVKIIQNGSGDAFVVEDVANGDASHFVINASGNTAIGLTAPLGNDKLTVSGNTSIYGALNATSISATTFYGLPTDIRVTGGTYAAGTATFTNNTGGTFTVTGFKTDDTFVTGGTPNNSAKTYTFTNNSGGTFTVNGLTDIFVTGGTANNSAKTYTFTNSTGGTFTVNGLTDIFTTGGTMAYVGSAGTATFTNSTGGTFNVTGFKDVFTTGGTYAAGTATFNNNDGTTYQVTGLTSTDTFVTGFTYSSVSNLLTISQNQGQAAKTVNITTMSGLSLSNLTAGRVPYVGTGGLLTDEAGFTYDTSTNILSLPSDSSLVVGTGGITIGTGGSAGVAGSGDLVVNGNLTVFGAAISAFTNQLYVEDPNITLNYNPTGNTTATSIGAGWTLQDGNGINGGNVNLNINRLDTLTGLTSTQVPSITEYVASTGYANRGWVTQLNDIVIRSTNVNTPNGVRVLTEFDILDGGSF